MKKIYITFLFIMSLFIVSCTNENVDYFNNLFIFSENDSFEHISKDFVLATKTHDHDIEWMSSAPHIIEIKGSLAKVTQPEEIDIKVTLTATLINHQDKLKQSFELNVIHVESKEEDVYVTIRILNSVTNEVIDSFEVLQNSELTTLNQPSFEGYDFKGFYINDSLISLPMILTQSIDIIARFTKIVTIYELTLNYGYDSKVEILHLEENTEYLLPNLTRPNYEFLGWFLEDQKVYTVNMTESKTVIAQWRIISAQTVIHKESFQGIIEYRDSLGSPKSEYINTFDYMLNNFSYSFEWYRTDLGISENSPKAVTLIGRGDGLGPGRGVITVHDVPNGIGYFSFHARLPYSKESTYPKGGGSDSANNVILTFTVIQNGFEVHQSKHKFADNKEASKGKVFTIENINTTGIITIVLEVSSGHRATISYIEWSEYKG